MITTPMTTEDFFKELEESFIGKYKGIVMRDMEEFFKDKEISAIGKRNLFNAIILNHTSSMKIPTMPQIVKIFNDTQTDFSFNSSGTLYSESPLQQLYRARDWPVERILNNCEKIRRKQKRLWDEGKDTGHMYSWELSFLAIWERLLDVIEEKREEAKQRMLDNGDRELRDPVDLKDIMRTYAPIKTEEPKRKGKTEHVESALEDIL